MCMRADQTKETLHSIFLENQNIRVFQRARGVVVSHPLSMREALGSIPSVSIVKHKHASVECKVRSVVLIHGPLAI